MKKKISICLIICLILGISFLVFKDKVFKDNNINNKKEENIDNKTEEKEIIDMKTSSGAVLVGTINKDEDGWYISLEQPLNITLTYYIDNPEYFKNVDKIRLLQENLDSLSHTLFVGENVTVTGEITNPRSAGTLYFVVFDIKSGKTVLSSEAKEDVHPPVIETEPFDYDKLPDKMKSKVVDNKYKYNLYMLSNESLEYVGNDFLNFYMDFVDAYLSYEKSVPCPSKSMAEKLESIIFYDFPIFNADASFNSYSDYDAKTKTINIQYKSKSKKEHDKIIDDFEKAANEFLNGVSDNQDDSTKAQIIYHNLTKSITYDYDGLETGLNLLPFNVYLRHSGVCFSFSFTYSQLLTQVGIESTIASSTPKGEIMGHSFNVIKIEDNYYFCDPTYELSYKNGTAYVYFGINMDQRLNNGEYDENTIYIGKYNTKLASSYGDFNHELSIKAID